jgi:hypothetical protein
MRVGLFGNILTLEPSGTRVFSCSELSPFALTPQEEGMGFSPAFATGHSLSSSEGVLVSLAIRVEPRRLETVLEALAQVAFPINPQIYHEAEIEFRDSTGCQAAKVTTLVEFPAYLARIDDVFRVLELNGFDRRDVLVTSMLHQLRELNRPENAQAGAEWTIRSRQPSASGH